MLAEEHIIIDKDSSSARSIFFKERPRYAAAAYNGHTVYLLLALRVQVPKYRVHSHNHYYDS